ncbi:MAG: YidC/Oxa1 family membrane protein insertase [Patescibacteria group bacterium]
MMELYNTFLYEPIYNLLIWLYTIIPGDNIGVAIIVLTLLIRAAFYPLQKKAIVSQKSLQDLQPKLEELKAKYKDNKEEMAQKVMALYKEHKINPASSCVPLLIQLPFLIAIYQVFRNGFDTANFDLLYPFVSRPDMIEPFFLGLDLSQPQWILAILAAIAQFWQAKMLQAKRPPIQSKGAQDEAFATIMQKQMTYVLPIITLWIGLRFPGGLTLYWFLTTLLTALQQLLIIGKDKNTKEVVKA